MERGRDRVGFYSTQCTVACVCGLTEEYTIFSTAKEIKGNIKRTFYVRK